MRWLRALWRLARVAVHILHGMALMALIFSRLDEAGRQRKVQWWSRTVLRLMSVDCAVQGAPRPGGVLLTPNHVSWLDIIAIHAVCPQARFVSKTDVLRWPLLGYLIQGGGTLFIERERKRDALRMVHEIAAALKRGDTVAVFPEGTTGPGTPVLPFHANLLQAAIAVEAPVQPVALRYAEPGQAFAWSAQYIDDTTLVASLWRVACARRLKAEVRFLAPQGSAHADRRALAARLKQQIQQVLDEAG